MSSFQQQNENVLASLMQLAQQGDEQSYRRLLESLSAVIERYLRRRLGNLECIEDIVQESLIGIHQARHTWQSHRPLHPWVFAIVRYKAIDSLRRLGNRQKHETVTSMPEEANTESVNHGGEHELEGQQLFHGLAPPFQEALLLTKVMGYSITEAAGRAGITEVAMKVRVHRALGALKKKLQEETNMNDLN